MNFLDLAQLILAVAAIVGVFVQWRNGRTTNKTGDAQAARDISEAYQTLLTPLERRIEELEADLRNSKTEAEIMRRTIDALGAELRSAKHMMAEYQAGTDKLVEQLKLHDMKPIWNPPDWIG